MRFAYALFTASLLISVHTGGASAQSPLKLNEILAGPARDWDGSGTISTRDDEWIEIVNGGSAPVDLAGYLLTDGDRLPRYGFSGTLGVGAVKVVFGKDAVDWERATANPVFGLSLGNTGDSAMLWQVVGADTVLIDSYTYLSHEAAADRAVGRMPDGGPWGLEDALDPYAGSTPPLGTGCAPSPGTSNLCGATPAQHVSWGRLKTLYR
jgi:lamin tail-like protein